MPMLRSTCFIYFTAVNCHVMSIQMNYSNRKESGGPQLLLAVNAKAKHKESIVSGWLNTTVIPYLLMKYKGFRVREAVVYFQANDIRQTTSFAVTWNLVPRPFSVNYKNIQQQQLTHSEVQLLVEDEEEEEEKGGSNRVDAIRYHLVSSGWWNCA